MSPETAQSVVVAIAAILGLVWLAALMAMFVATRAQSSGDRDVAGRYEIEDRVSENAIVGEVEVDGSPEQLSAKLRSVLGRGVYGPFGPVEIVSSDAREVAFEAVGTASRRRRGRFRLSPLGSRTRIGYAIDASAGRVVMLALGWTFVALGLVALAAVAWLQFQFVLPSLNPRTRVQSVQMLQAVHFIWPPFLFAYLSGRTGRFARAAIEALVKQLPYAA